MENRRERRTTDTLGACAITLCSCSISSVTARARCCVRGTYIVHTSGGRCWNRSCRGTLRRDCGGTFGIDPLSRRLWWTTSCRGHTYTPRRAVPVAMPAAPHVSRDVHRPERVGQVHKEGSSEEGDRTCITAFIHALCFWAETAGGTEAFPSIGSFLYWSITPSENPFLLNGRYFMIRCI